MKNEVINKMIQYYTGDPKRIQHFIKVHSFARLIGQMENLDGPILEVLETASIVHDIGIKPAEEKFGDCNGKLQEQEGPAVAENMLTEVGYSKEIIDRVCYLVGHHHTYTDIDGFDYQILVEADFLVNLYEDMLNDSAIKSAYLKIFKTKSGKAVCREMFGLSNED